MAETRSGTPASAAFLTGAKALCRGRSGRNGVLTSQPRIGAMQPWGSQRSFDRLAPVRCTGHLASLKEPAVSAIGSASSLYGSSTGNTSIDEEGTRQIVDTLDGSQSVRTIGFSLVNDNYSQSSSSVARRPRRPSMRSTSRSRPARRPRRMRPTAAQQQETATLKARGPDARHAYAGLGDGAARPRVVAVQAASARPSCTP